MLLTLTAIVDLNTADINVEVLLRDAAGKIVGADWGDTGKFLARLAAGEKAKVTAFVAVENGDPATAGATVG